MLQSPKIVVGWEERESPSCWGCSADTWVCAGSWPDVLWGWSWKALRAGSADQWEEQPGATSSKQDRWASPGREEEIFRSFAFSSKKFYKDTKPIGVSLEVVTWSAWFAFKFLVRSLTNEFWGFIKDELRLMVSQVWFPTALKAQSVRFHLMVRKQIENNVHVNPCFPISHFISHLS